jgi:hypothetical protein
MKRQRCEEWWTLLCDEIVSNGGFVHTNLEFSNNNNNGNRDLIVNKKVNKDEILLKIPTANFMTKQQAFLMCPSLKYILELQTDDGSPPTKKGSSSKYKNSTADLGKLLLLLLLLLLYLLLRTIMSIIQLLCIQYITS